MRKISLVELSQMEDKPDKVYYNNYLFEYTNADYYCNDIQINQQLKTTIPFTSFNKPLINIEEEPLLTNEERTYLSNIIKPFRDRVEYITRSEVIKYSIVYEYIAIIYEDLDKTEEQIKPPYYEKGTLYKGMELNKRYTLEELDL